MPGAASAADMVEAEGDEFLVSGSHEASIWLTTCHLLQGPSPSLSQQYYGFSVVAETNPNLYSSQGPTSGPYEQRPGGRRWLLWAEDAKGACEVL